MKLRPAEYALFGSNIRSIGSAPSRIDRPIHPTPIDRPAPDQPFPTERPAVPGKETGHSRQRGRTFPAKKPAAASRRKAGPAGRKPHPDTPPKPSDGVSNLCSNVRSAPDVRPTHMPTPTLPTSSIPPTSAAAPYRPPSANRAPPNQTTAGYTTNQATTGCTTTYIHKKDNTSVEPRP